MEYEINQIPFKMEQIPDQLFNSPFLSDVTFLIGDQFIYAHSLELMKRSTVFQKQLEPTLGEKKIIPITDYGYDLFYQLIHFIYTDEYAISNDKRVELLKLAKVYNVIRLINELLNRDSDYIGNLNFCVVEKHEIGINQNKLCVNYNLCYYLKSNELLALHPATVAEILNFDQIDVSVNETDILYALVRWMNRYCIKNEIQFDECRQKFYYLFNLIRFPTMTKDELRDFITKYPDLLTSDEFQNIASHKIYGADKAGGIWNSLPRIKFIYPYDFEQFSSDSRFESTFTVSSDLILSGFVLGWNVQIPKIDITISCDHPGLDKKTQINITDVNVFQNLVVTSLATSFRPNITYTISYKTIGKTSRKLNLLSRKRNTELNIKAPLKSVNIIKAHETTLEMFFLKAD